MNKSDWFTDWFNTSYYHTLYKDRNDIDAQLFIRNVIDFLKIPLTSHLLDLPCGKGRHSIYLNSLGYKVTGADLSQNSIKAAKIHENSTLDFKLKDMRKPFELKYDAVFNLFTSFGYFENDEDDILVLENIKKGLNKNGLLILDFLNVVTVKNNLVKKEIKTVDNITFNIQREIKNGFILKHISFYDKGIKHAFLERVKYLDLKKFETYFSEAGLRIHHVFGDYHLSKFNPNTSKRLIFVVS